MTTEQFLARTAALEWSTAEAIATYLDALGLWPEDTPIAVKVRDVDQGLRATDAIGWPRVARVKRDSGPWLYKQEAAFTAADYTEVIAYEVAQVKQGKARATEARDAAVQQSDAHLALPWEHAPDA